MYCFNGIQITIHKYKIVLQHFWNRFLPAKLFLQYTMTDEEFQRPKPKERTKKYFVRTHRDSYWHMLRSRFRQNKFDKSKGQRSKSQPDMLEENSQPRTLPLFASPE
ncbi:hypothetical protein ACJBU6_07229 [Exserohilum turcicum]